MNNKFETESEKPPLFKSWRTWYILVLLNLILLILIFGLFSEYFS